MQVTDETEELRGIVTDAAAILAVAVELWNEVHPDEPDEIFTDLRDRCLAAISHEA